MEISISGQAAAFAGAVALGFAAGVLYDVFRILRARAARRVLSAGLDLLFWVAVTAALFSYALTAGDGEIRIFMILGIAIGAFLYFLLLSAIILRLGNKIADLIALALHFLTVPFLFALNLLKKSKKKLKNIFHYSAKWYRIKHTFRAAMKNRGRLNKR